MNEEALNDILRGIQSSRPMASKILYGGDLQDNTDQYFRPSPFHNEDSVPKAPANLFCEYGATAEVDKRPFMTPQPQVPRDPELEGLNEYFNKQRVLSYARGVSGMVISEVLAKQAEQVANSYVKDEIDRRSGIRKSVLMGSGVPEADATRQIATEALAGINPRTMDMRDKQITDAVNMYYRINNLPTPVTQPAPNAIPATLPSGVEQAIPQEEAELGESANADMYDESDEMPALEDEGMVAGGEGGFGIAGKGAGSQATDPYAESTSAGSGSGSSERPFRPGQEDADNMTKLQLVDYIRQYNVLTPTTGNTRTGAMLSPDRLDRNHSVRALREIVREHIEEMKRRFPEF
jgi:hypothetical protein